MMRGNGSLYRRPGNRYWWIAWYVKGKRYARSTGSVSKTEAQVQLREELQKARAGINPVEGRITYEQLREMLLSDYRINGRRSLYDLEHSRLTHLDKAFGGMKALDITGSAVKAYIQKRKDEGAANASINRERSAIMRMFQLAIDTQLLSETAMPRGVKPLREENARKGFFERDQFNAILKHLPDYLVPIVQTAYITGWRRSEILSRQKRHIDMKAGWLRLEPNETKNGEGREFPLTLELWAVLARQIEATAAFEREHGRIVPWLFHRKGKPLASFRKAWATACRQAGLAGKIPHDFRRTAVRNLERAGVSRSAAMKMTGHLTESVYRRYAIVDSTMLKEAAHKMDVLAAGRTANDHQTATIPTK